MRGRGITEFRIGDVVEIGGWFGSIDTPDELRNGIVIEVNSKPKKKWDYKVFWFTGNVYSLYEGELTRCEDGDWCRECEDKDLCPHLLDIARCDISEFGQLRGEGKYNPDVCKQRQCKHLGVCLTTRFIQEQD